MWQWFGSWSTHFWRFRRRNPRPILIRRIWLNQQNWYNAILNKWWLTFARTVLQCHIYHVHHSVHHFACIKYIIYKWPNHFSTRSYIFNYISSIKVIEIIHLDGDRRNITKKSSTPCSLILFISEFILRSNKNSKRFEKKKIASSREKLTQIYISPRQ